jgi:hypothetical protein
MTLSGQYHLSTFYDKEMKPSLKDLKAISDMVGIHCERKEGQEGQKWQRKEAAGQWSLKAAQHGVGG